jgi:predicted nucleic acid-binding protein
LEKKFNHTSAVKAAKIVLESKTFIVENTLESARNHALEKFKTQGESVSFTDCIVMAFADEYKTKAIFGFDESFKRSGYVRIGIDRDKKS